MKAFKKLFLFTVLGFGLLFQSGCWDQKLYEDIGFLLQIGLEYDQNKNIIISKTSPVIDIETQERVEVLSTSQSLVRAARDYMRNASGKMLQGGKIQHVYFSSEVARNGIYDFLDIFWRNPENPLLAFIVIVDGSPLEMMEFGREYKDKPRPAIYMSELLRDALLRSNSVEMRIYHFSVLYHSRTIDPVAPLVRYNDRHMEIAGSALFTGDKMVGEINIDQTFLLNLLMRKDIMGDYIFKDQISGGENLKNGSAIFLKTVKRKVNINTGKQPDINISLDITAQIDEYTGENNLDEPDKLKLFEKAVAAAIQSDCLSLLEHLQSVGTDPIGFGEVVRSKHNAYWKSVDWREEYKKAGFKVDVKLNIDFYGAMK